MIYSMPETNYMIVLIYMWNSFIKIQKMKKISIMQEKNIKQGVISKKNSITASIHLNYLKQSLLLILKPLIF